MTTHNLAGMYKEIKRQDIIPIAASVLPFDSATPDQSAQIQRLNRWIKDAADKLNIPYVDLHSVVADAQNADRLNGSADGIHPDVGGYRQIGQALAKEIDRLESKGVLPR